MSKTENGSRIDEGSAGARGAYNAWLAQTTYLRELPKLATIDVLLGPAGGPHEEIVRISYRDRHLVGKQIAFSKCEWKCCIQHAIELLVGKADRLGPTQLLSEDY